LLKKLLKKKVEEILKNQLGIEEEVRFDVDKPRRSEFGDYATNVALVIASRLKRPPIKIAEEIAEVLRREETLEKVEPSPPGFINFTVKRAYYVSQLLKLLKEKENFGRSDIGKGKRVLLEFVSANPTGPLHIGHGRGAAYGDTLARLLKYTGFDVTTEYYINDQGTQMKILGRSVYLRAKELKGEEVEFPEDHYKGSYIYDIARELLGIRQDLLDLPEDEAVEVCKEFALKKILEDIKTDLANFRVHFDNWFSERELYQKGIVEKVMSILKDKGLIYEKDGALWFKATEFGDEKDRVIRRSNGEYTYFAGDIAYHYDKFKKRGYDICINLWGADHHGYVKRIKAALKAFGVKEESLVVLLIQMVNLIEEGERKSMSTRQGEFVELKELLRDVGVDATRFIFLSRSSDSPLDFDVELAKKQSQENPVYYVQYAHARICSIFRKAKERGIKVPPWDEVNFDLLELPEEIRLLKRFEEFKEVIEASSLGYAPYRITYFLLDLAKDFHEYYTKYRVIGERDELMFARMGLCEACRIVVKSGLDILGVSAPERM